VGVGMKAAGIHHAWGIEIDDKIAGVARLNGFNVHTGDVLKADPHCFEQVDVLHASTICTRASQANANAGEAPEDVALGQKTAAFIDVLQPRIFTLENVWFYRTFEAFQVILNALNRNGYIYHYEHVNSADFSVPQTRKRLILRAVRGALLPPLPPAERWRGWYESIEDLIPDLPPSQFAEWQLNRLPCDLATFAMQVQGANGDGLRYAGEPMQSITAAHGAGKYRAFITDGQTNEGERLTTRFEDEPMLTVSTGTGSKRGCRAWLSHGRVVKMTPRALARFQSFPDWYQLSGKNTLDCKGIGNAMPPLWYQKIVRQLI
jgi:DNA (cytosine-5)-methyltransferase 1